VKERYLATYVSPSKYDPDTLREVVAVDAEAALVAARAAVPAWWRPEMPPTIYISGPLSVSADHNGSTHGD
jgi:hypothetical protein